jgi:shikimate kinase
MVAWKNMIGRPIVFIGMLGSGKTTVGRKIASRLNLAFYDSDKHIEEQEKLTLVDIYDFKGEDYFRAKEADLIKNVLNQGPLVLSTGGSTFVRPDLRKLIKEKAISIWLRAEIDVLYTRVSRKNTRPELNNGDKRELLAAMLEEWGPIYSEADIVVDSRDFDLHFIVDTVLLRLKNFLLSKNV